MDGLYDCDDSVMTMMMMMMTKTTTTKTTEDAPDASVSQRLTYFLTSFSCMLSRRMYFCTFSNIAWPTATIENCKSRLGINQVDTGH